MSICTPQSADYAAFLLMFRMGDPSAGPAKSGGEILARTSQQRYFLVTEQTVSVETGLDPTESYWKTAKERTTTTATPARKLSHLANTHLGTTDGLVLSQQETETRRLDYQ